MACLLAAAAASPSYAVQPDEILPDAAMEQRARSISGGLRCLVCQNQSIDDSDAPLARDLRLLVRERLKAGDNDLQVRDYIVARYGEFVLLKPPVSGSTLLLWSAPLLILLSAIGWIWSSYRRASADLAGTGEALSADERAALEKLLNDKPGQDTR
jgi:cytochrome c-type biogenesis protein CcmH